MHVTVDLFVGTVTGTEANMTENFVFSELDVISKTVHITAAKTCF